MPNLNISIILPMQVIQSQNYKLTRVKWHVYLISQKTNYVLGVLTGHSR